MALRYLVRGGNPLNGTIRPAGNKNAALPILAATLLAEGPSTLENIPRIRDVLTLLDLLEDLGCSVEWLERNTVRVDTGTAQPKPLDPKLCARIRASILLAGPMLARFGRVTLPPPGGDVIGRRRVDTHFLALEQLGAQVNVGDDYTVEAKRLRGADIFLDEPSVTGTENALMAAVAAEGRTVLRNAAAEPHVQDLARYLVALGASIDGIGSNVYVIEGGRPLRGASHTVGPDHIEIGSFISLAAVTNGSVHIEGVRGDDLRATLLAVDRLGIRPRLDGNHLYVDANQERRIRPDLGGHVPKLEDGPLLELHQVVSMSLMAAKLAGWRSFTSTEAMARTWTLPLEYAVLSNGLTRMSSSLHTPMSTSERSPKMSAEHTAPDEPFTRFEGTLFDAASG